MTDKPQSVLQVLSQMQAARATEVRVVTHQRPRGQTQEVETPETAPSLTTNLRLALQHLRNKNFLHSRKYQDQQWRANWEGVHPDVIEFTRVMIKRMGALGVPMFPHCAMRTIEDQNAVYVMGNSRAKGGQSPHNYGCAVDIVHSTKAWDMSKPQWELIGHVGRELITQKGYAMHSLAWGGDWSFYDPAHWELIDWKIEKAKYPWPKLLPF